MCSDGLSLEDEEQIHQAAVDPSKSNIITAFATAMVQGEPLSQSEIQDGALEKSPNIDKHEALADSPGNSRGTRTPHSSTGESEKHEGLAEPLKIVLKSLFFLPVQLVKKQKTDIQGIRRQLTYQVQHHMKERRVTRVNYVQQPP